MEHEDEMVLDLVAEMSLTMLWNPFSDAHGKWYLGPEGFLNASSSERRAYATLGVSVLAETMEISRDPRHKEGRCSRAGLFDSVLNIDKNWKAEMGLSSLLGVRPANHFGAVVDRLLRMEAEHPRVSKSPIAVVGQRVRALLTSPACR